MSRFQSAIRQRISRSCEAGWWVQSTHPTPLRRGRLRGMVRVSGGDGVAKGGLARARGCVISVLHAAGFWGSAQLSGTMLEV